MVGGGGIEAMEAKVEGHKRRGYVGVVRRNSGLSGEGSRGWGRRHKRGGASRRSWPCVPRHGLWTNVAELRASCMWGGLVEEASSS